MKCRIDTVISPDDGHIVARNMYRKEINILRKIVHKVGFTYKIIQGRAVNKKLFHTKFHYNPFSCCKIIQMHRAILICAMQGYKHA